MMRRPLLHPLTALSLLLCAASVVMWVRSYSRGDTWVAWEREGARCFSDVCQVVSARGGVVVYRDVSSAGPRPSWCRPGAGTAAGGFAEALGFEDRSGVAYLQVFNPEFNGTLGSYRRELRVPYWSLLTVTGLAPTTWAAVRLLRRGRRAKGLCPACGYDLTANASGVCPECGTMLR